MEKCLGSGGEVFGGDRVPRARGLLNVYVRIWAQVWITKNIWVLACCISVTSPIGVANSVVCSFIRHGCIAGFLHHIAGTPGMRTG